MIATMAEKTVPAASLKVIFSLFGPPGSGKGTLAEQAREELGFSVLSLGNVCRAHIAQKTEFGQQLSEYVQRGELVPDGLVVSLVKDWFIEQIKVSNNIIFDGFPRTKKQAELFLAWQKKEFPEYCFRVILVDLTEDDIVKRLAGRRVCSQKSCQIVYSKAYEKNVCFRCDSVLVTREDDQEDVVRQRLRLYPMYRDSLLDYYQSIGKPVEKICVEDMSVGQVFATFKAIL